MKIHNYMSKLLCIVCHVTVASFGGGGSVDVGVLNRVVRRLSMRTHARKIAILWLDPATSQTGLPEGG